MTDSNAAETVLDRTVDALNAIFGPADPSTIFSQPIVAGDRIVVTASAWDRAGGFGFGMGSGGEHADPVGSGGGGGGGGSSQGRPVAVIDITEHGVRVEPVIDLTKIAITAALAAVGVWRALGRG